MSNKPYSNLICPICKNKGDYVREEEEVHCLHCGLVIETPYHYTAGVRFKTLAEILDDEKEKKYQIRKRRKENERIKKFQKYSWLISAIFAVIVFISGLTVNDLSFLPVEYQAKAVGVIGACALIVKILPENYRVYIAEMLVRDEYEVPKECLAEKDEEYV